MATDKVSEEYGSLVFTDAEMQDRLPKPTYKELRQTIDEGKPINLKIANEVAHAMTGAFTDRARDQQCGRRNPALASAVPRYGSASGGRDRLR